MIGLVQRDVCFAIVPAIIEEYIFRGVILGAYLKVEMMAAYYKALDLRWYG